MRPVRRCRQQYQSAQYLNDRMSHRGKLDQESDRHLEKESHQNRRLNNRKSRTRLQGHNLPEKNHQNPEVPVNTPAVPDRIQAKDDERKYIDTAGNEEPVPEHKNELLQFILSDTVSEALEVEPDIESLLSISLAQQE